MACDAVGALKVGWVAGFEQANLSCVPSLLTTGQPLPIRQERPWLEAVSMCVSRFDPERV